MLCIYWIWVNLAIGSFKKKTLLEFCSLPGLFWTKIKEVGSCMKLTLYFLPKNNDSKLLGEPVMERGGRHIIIPYIHFIQSRLYSVTQIPPSVLFHLRGFLPFPRKGLWLKVKALFLGRSHPDWNAVITSSLCGCNRIKSSQNQNQKKGPSKLEEASKLIQNKTEADP